MNGAVLHLGLDGSGQLTENTVGLLDPDTGCAIAIEKLCVAGGFTPLEAVTVAPKVPGTCGVPESNPFAARLSPAGSTPDVTANVGAGVPVATNMWAYGSPTVPDAGNALVKAGGAVGADIVMEKLCVDAGSMPLEAVTVPVNGPTTVGVPVTAPVDGFKDRPSGNAPAVTMNVGAGVPVAT
jgi:hypothetical protein